MLHSWNNLWGNHAAQSVHVWNDICLPASDQWGGTIVPSLFSQPYLAASVSELSRNKCSYFILCALSSVFWQCLSGSQMCQPHCNDFCQSRCTEELNVEIYVKTAFRIHQRCQAPERNFWGINTSLMVGGGFLVSFFASTGNTLYKASLLHSGFLIWEKERSQKSELKNWQNLGIKPVIIRNLIYFQRNSGIA